jgi:hypothetical protein
VLQAAPASTADDPDTDPPSLGEPCVLLAGVPGVVVLTSELLVILAAATLVQSFTLRGCERRKLSLRSCFRPQRESNGFEAPRTRVREARQFWFGPARRADRA